MSVPAGTLVSSDNYILRGNDGLYLVAKQEISTMELNSVGSDYDRVLDTQ
jgi:hypothetical protein